MSRATPPRKDKAHTGQLDIKECHDLLLNAPIGVFAATLEGRFLWVNPAMARLFGYETPRQMISSVTSIPMQIYAEPSDRLESQRLVELHGQMVNHECQMLRRDGSLFWVSITARVVREKNGSIANYQGFATDITDRKQIEESLLRTQFGMDRAPDSILWVDDQGNMVYANDAACSSMGYTREELLRMTVFDMDPDFPLEGWEQHKRDLKRLGRMIFEGRHRTRDGRLFPVEVTTNYLEYKGRFFAIAFDRDITERKKAEEASKRSEVTYREIFNAVTDGIFIHDMDTGEIQDVNARVLEMYGYSRDEVRSLTVGDLSSGRHPYTQETVAGLIAKAAAGEPQLFEWHSRHKSGRLFWSEISLKRGNIGGVERVLAIEHDITERKRTEDALRQKNIELDALNQLAQAVTSQVSLEDACRAAIEQVTQTLRPDAVVLFMREGNDLRLMASGPDHKCHPIESAPIHRVGECLCGLAVSAKQPIYVADIAGDERCTWAECRNAGLRSFAAIPLCLGDESIGILGAASATQRDFQQAARYLETAADQIAISIHHARLLDQTRAYAAQLQEAIAERDGTQRSLEDNEKQLTTANIMLRNVLETIPVGVFWKDRDGRYLGCNTLFARDVGRQRPEDVVGMRDIEIEPPDRAARFRDEDRTVMESGQAKIGYEDVRTAPDGGQHVSLCSKVPLRNDAGEIIGVLGTYEDITQRKRTEETLRDRETLLRSLFQAVPLGIGVLDAGKRILSVNDGVVKILGYWQDELIGRSLRSLWVSGEEYLQAEEMLFGNRGAIGVASAEVRLRRKDGAEIWVLLSVSPLDTEDASAGSVAAAIDITARKSLEGQLRQSQKMEAIGQLAGGVAHDFNNMLQAIIGYTEIVMQDLGPDDRNHARLMEIHKASERATALTRQLLAFSRRQLLTLGPLDLNQAVDDLMKMVRRLIGENIELRVTPCRDLWTVNADRGQIEQVIMNLCLNARDAMPEGGALSIETGNVLFDARFCARHEWAKPGGYVLLSVTDSGCGMDEETKEKIFEPFFTTKESGKGTGLGLATVYGIMRQHDGMIQVYSEPGKGSRFSLYLPAIEQVETAIPEPEAPVAGGHETIVLAEDNEQIRLLAREVLKGSGYTVLEAADGEEALHVYQDQAREIDLLLLDVVMPKKGGRNVYDEIRAVRSDVKCLFISGYSVDAVHTNFILDQGLHLIQKPFRNTDLLRGVRRILDLSQQSGQ